MRRYHSVLHQLIVVFTLVALLLPTTGAAAQTPAVDEQVSALLDQMTTAQKIGQLFLVRFVGDNAGADSGIADLIRNYNVGGVILTPDNFPAGKPTPTQVAALTNRLQGLAFGQILPADPFTITTPLTATLDPGNLVEGVDGTTTRIPLFLAIDHEGDGYPYTWLSNGYTPLPSLMAIGATWKPENAAAVGRIVGSELAASGVNLLLGPSLDVLDNPRVGRDGDLGVRTFGGDSYWVGRMGQAYIRGVHEGSAGRGATVARHFPGQGASDRRPEDEVATVQKPLAALQQVELPPFAAATRIDPQGTFTPTEALMSSHIRYRGFQANTRQLTPPISLAPQLQTILGLPEFKPWRDNGGLVVSDALGVPAVRRYYDAELRKFPHRQVALDAFTAGNDLLMVTHFALTDDYPQEVANIKDTIVFFREKYDNDPDFRARADAALTRILTAKLKMTGQFALDRVLSTASSTKMAAGSNLRKVTDIAKEAITLLYPGPQELADRVPSSPLADENLVVFTDSREVKNCTSCSPFQAVPVDAIQNIILRLYGPQSTGQVQTQRVTSYSFDDLKKVLDGRASSVESAPVQVAIRDADYLIFAMLDVAPDEAPSSDVVKAFLRQRSDSLRDKKIIVLALKEPYYLDTTETSKLTALYGVYSKTEPALEAAVRALFREFTPTGVSPVNVPGVNYDLQTRLEADPTQVIPIVQVNTDSSGEQPAEPIPLKAGDTLQLMTGIIADRNGNPVPDGTPVTFRLFYANEALELPRQEVTTVDGVARTNVKLERTGELRITASSGPATESTTLLVTIQGDSPITIATVVPTPTPSPSPSPTPEPTETPEPTPTDPPPLAATPRTPSALSRVDFVTFVLAMMALLGAVGLIVLVQGTASRQPDVLVRTVAWVTICGLTAYVLYSLGWLPGATRLQWAARPWGGVIVTFTAALLPLVVFVWKRRARTRV